MAKKLISRDEYSLPPRGLHYKRGEVFEASDELMLFLMADAPENFAVYVEPEVKAVDAPVADKMVSEPPANKMVKRPKVKK